MFVGEICTLLAAMFWAVSLVGYQLYAPRVSALSINLLKNTIALITCLAVVGFAQLQFPMDSSMWWWMLACGAIGTGLGDFCLIRSMQLIGPQLATSIQLFVPVLSIVIGYFLLGEALSFSQVIGIAMCLVGVWMILQGSNKEQKKADPSDKSFLIGLAIALGCTASFTFGMVSMRVAAQAFDIWSGTIIKVVGANAFLLCLKPFSSQILGQKKHEPLFGKARKVPLILFSFVGSGFGLVLLTAGGKYAYIGVVSTLASTPPLWLLPLGVMFLGEKMSFLKTVGVLIALVGVLLISVPGLLG